MEQKLLYSSKNRISLESTMAFNISKSYTLMAQALDYRAMRQDMISSNIANADTPFYKPRDVRFEDMLAQKAEDIYGSHSEDIYGSHSEDLELAQTQKGHMAFKSEIDPYKATTFFRDGHAARNDGNSVDIDVETTEMAKNSTMFNAVIAAYKKDAMIMRSVIDASSKV